MYDLPFSKNCSIFSGMVTDPLRVSCVLFGEFYDDSNFLTEILKYLTHISFFDLKSYTAYFSQFVDKCIECCVTFNDYE